MLLFKNRPCEDLLAELAWGKIATAALGPDFASAPSFMVAESKKRSLDVAPNTLVFINGRYAPESSLILSEGVQILSVEDAKKKYQSFFSVDLRKKIEEEKSQAALVNHSYSEEGIFIYLSPNQKISLTIRHFFTDTGICFPKVHAIVGAHSILTLIIEQTTEKGVWVNQLIDLHLSANAQIKIIELLDKSEGVFIDTIRASLKEEALLDTTLVSRGAEMAFRDFHAKLLGQGSEAKVSMACHLQEKQEERINVLMELKAPFTRSFQKIKHVGNRNSRHHFKGKIYVHREAQNSDSYQRHQALLLDEFAFQTVKPELEIFADDVKASHGASCGNLNKDHLFYFTSRGIDRQSAEKMLVQGHLQEIAESITDQNARIRASEILR